MLINKVLIKPILTEKATNLVQSNVYMFEVDKRANKFQIKQALEKLYKVKTGAVKIMIRKGKERKTGKKMRSNKRIQATRDSSCLPPGVNAHFQAVILA